jgi:hypothetical protein
MATGPRYIASARTARKTPLPTALLLLRACLLRPSRACLQSRSLATAVSAGFTVLALSKYTTILNNLVLFSVFLSDSGLVNRWSWIRFINLKTLLILIRPRATQSKSAMFLCFFFLLQNSIQAYIRGGLISLWLYKENNKLQDSKNVFTLHNPPRAPHTYDFAVVTSSTHPRKILLVVLQIGK